MTLLFRNSGNTEAKSAGIKNSLRKIPSSLFRIESAEPPQKDKTTKRKGFANILGWAKSDPTPPPPMPLPTATISGPRSMGSHPASRHEIHHRVDKLAPLQRRTSNATSAWAWSLRSTSSSTNDHSVPENKTRPSCPPDPFECTAGARIIDRPFPQTERAPNVKHIEAERRTPKITTVFIDDVDDVDEANPDESWVASLSNFEVAPLPLDYHPDMNNEVPGCTVPNRSSWMPCPVVSNDKYVRPGSLGRSLELTLDSIRESEEPVNSSKTLKRERTKSRVWAMFSSKAKKSAVTASFGKNNLSRSATPIDPFERPPIPTLCVTKPSTEFTLPSPLKPQMSPSPLLVAPGSPMHSRQPTDGSSKTLPKRKSLSGLFGINIKRSTDMLRSPRSSPKKSLSGSKSPRKRRSFPKFAAQPSPRSPSKRNPKPTPLRRMPSNDTSPDTVAFFNRFGTTAQGSLKQTDVTTSDTSCATTQLERFLASIGPSASPIPLRKMRSTGLLVARKHSPVPKGSSSVTSTPGRARGRGRLSPSPSPVANLMKGMRTILVSSSSPPPSPSPARFSPPAFRPDEVKARLNVEPEIGSQAVTPTLLECETIVTPVTPTYPTCPLPGLPAPPPEDRKVDRLAQRRQHKKANTPDSEFLTAGQTEEDRASFDFTHEVLSLERGDGRRSFIKALHHALSSEALSSPLREYSPSAKSRKTPESQASPSRPARRSPAPFEGQPAFQRFVEQTRAAKLPTPPLTLPPPFALPPLPPSLSGLPMSEGQAILAHGRHESAISFASISSLGAPLGGSTLTHDYTNYFETNYTGIEDIPPVLPPLATMPVYTAGASISRHRRGHRHSTSASSVSSVGGAEISYVSGSIRFSTRASYMTRQQPQPFADVSMNDTDMHSNMHVLRPSTSSSVVSVARIARPTVGERMFERDRNVRLDSYHAREDSCWSLASYDGSGEAETLEASVFGVPSQSTNGSFFIKSRPMSGISTSSSEAPDDTFDGFSNALDELKAEIGMAPSGSSSLRPVAPSRVVRNRPEPLKLSDFSLDTPGLDTAYTSADDSSLFSFDSRNSNAPLSAPLSSSFSSFFPSVHARHHSSIATANVKVDATIPEENSQSSLRSMAPSNAPPNDSFNYWEQNQTVTSSWFQWQREAEDVCHQNQAMWINNGMGDLTMTDEPLPTTGHDIQKFLAASRANYKPLDHASDAAVVRQRKNSASRLLAAPCSAPIPPLESRFRNKRNSAEESDCELSVNALLVEFAREQAPYSKPKPPRLVKRHSYNNSQSEPEAFRQTVTNSVRRRNLGWGRRRPSTDSGNASASSHSVHFADEDVFGVPEPQARRAREKQPSFICFSPIEADQVCEPPRAPSPSEHQTQEAPKRRREVKVTAMGSPLNLNLELDPSPLTERRSGRLSYEPGHSPLKMRPLQTASKVSTGKAAGKTAAGPRPLLTRPTLRPANGSQHPMKALKTSSSPHLPTKTGCRSTYKAQSASSRAPASRAPSKKVMQNENDLPVMRPAPRMQPVRRAALV